MIKWLMGETGVKFWLWRIKG